MPTVVVDGSRVDYTDAGTGLPLVFVSGLFGSAEWFRYQASGLSERHRVIGYGLRSARRWGDYSLDSLVNDLVRLLDRLRIHGAVVVGHSLGATLALRFAATHPERTLAVGAISAAPSYAGISQEDILEHLSPGEVEVDGVLARLWRRVSGAKLIRPIDASDPHAYLAEHGGRIDRSTMRARLRLLCECDMTPWLSQIEAPALIVAGALDWSRILGGSQAIDYAISDSQLEVLEAADHFCFYTRHDIFNAVLDDFVTREVPRL